MVGLDAAGKTTILYKLKLGEGKEDVPNLGLSSSSTDLLTDYLLFFLFCSCYHHPHHW